ncbi:MAG: aminotransferase class V-fold PLP-dependent enzyme [Bauldia sp.]|nr:aminotransferase class V-fold PLP-dependent enzyme [Bauldia sp.]
MARTSGPPIDARDLLIPEGVVHLQAGGEAPLPRAALSAFDRYARDKAGGILGRSRMESVNADVRKRVASLAGIADDSSLAFVGSASVAISAAIAGMEWSEGENIVTLADEFPSVVLAPLALDRLGVSLRVVDPGDDPERALAEASDRRTRLACVSHVSFRHGRRLDLERLSSLVAPNGTSLLVDASHSLGVLGLPVDVCDVITSCAHKFLLGAHGTGILIWNPRRLGPPRSPAFGWFSVDGFKVESGQARFAARPGAGVFELGNPNFGSLYALSAGLDLLEKAGAADIETYALDLSATLRRELVRAGWPVMTPEDRGRRGTSIAVPVPDSEALARKLAELGVVVASGEGRIRLSIHAFNTKDNVEALLAALAQAVA